MSSPRVWLVTGSSAGFGRETVTQLLHAGEKVVATLRTPSALADLSAKYPPSQLQLVQLDVTNRAAIKAAFAHARAAFGRVDAVFNNAGYIAIGEAEAVPDEVARALFEVNFWGAVHVAQEAVRFFREENKPQGGLLLQNSSTSGLVGIPVCGFYAATKHALEGWTESLASELDPAWNIKVTLIEPGAFKTSVFEQDRMVVVPAPPVYDTPSLPGWHLRGAVLKNAGQAYDTTAELKQADPAKAVAKIIELGRLENPPLRFAVGKDSIVSIRGKLKKVEEELDAYESWSENLA